MPDPQQHIDEAAEYLRQARDSAESARAIHQERGESVRQQAALVMRRFAEGGVSARVNYSQLASLLTDKEPQHSGDAPDPVITDRGSGDKGPIEIMAPGVVHVHATASKLSQGDWLNAKVEWDFGDEGSEYNNLRGFNAAHFYKEPGSYEVTLSITQQNGESATVSRAVEVRTNTRTKVYVDPSNGSPSPENSGEPYDTITNAWSNTEGSDIEFIMASGEVHRWNTRIGSSDRHNIVVRPSDANERFLVQPETGALIGQGTDLILMDADVIESEGLSDNFRLIDSRNTQENPGSGAVINVTSRNDLANAGVTDERSRGVLLQNVDVDDTTRSNNFWGAGDMNVLLGCRIRHAGGERAYRGKGDWQLIHDSTITNGAGQKMALTRQGGAYLYISESLIETEQGGGALQLAHNSSGSADSDSEWVVVERTRIKNSGIILSYNNYQTLSKAVIRNVIAEGRIHAMTSELEGSDRPMRDVRIYHTTMVSNGHRHFWIRGGGWESWTFRNNLAVGYESDQHAPETVNIGSNGGFEGHSPVLRDNVFPTARDDDHVRIDGSYMSWDEFQPQHDWASGNRALDVSLDDEYRVSNGDLTVDPPDDMAQFAEDFYGSPRPSDTWAVGAVE